MENPTTVADLKTILDGMENIYHQNIQHLRKLPEDIELDPQQLNMFYHEDAHFRMYEAAKEFYRNNSETFHANPTDVVKALWAFEFHHPFNSNWKPRDTLPYYVTVCEKITGIEVDELGHEASTNPTNKLLGKVARDLYPEDLDYNYVDGLYLRSHFDANAKRKHTFYHIENHRDQPRYFQTLFLTWGYETASQIRDKHAKQLIGPKDNCYIIWEGEEEEIAPEFIAYQEERLNS